MKQGTSFILGIIVVLLIAGAAYTYFGNKQAEAPTVPVDTADVTINTSPNSLIEDNTVGTSTSTTSGTVTVTYTSNGFSPDSATIKVGDTVTFVNQSDGSMWLASSPHPVHTDYPEFDEKEAVANGGSYKFTFSKAGSWAYHNHLSPGKRGTIVVQ
ncbi:MAG: cupredoxin domain-containing protein [bacterium]|nr:cupredoxin domain-containing protein [bacterium]